MADITVFGNKSKFNEDAEFFKDVYIYGTLYYDDLIGKGAFDNLIVNGDGYFGLTPWVNKTTNSTIRNTY